MSEKSPRNIACKYVWYHRNYHLFYVPFYTLINYKRTKPIINTSTKKFYQHCIRTQNSSLQLVLWLSIRRFKQISITVFASKSITRDSCGPFTFHVEESRRERGVENEINLAPVASNYASEIKI